MAAIWIHLIGRQVRIRNICSERRKKMGEEPKDPFNSLYFRHSPKTIK